MLASQVLSQTPTFHEDIAPIIYENCTQCHREGEIGPMQFITYEEVSQQGSFIEYVTQSGYMPPWAPDHNYSTFVGERYLTQGQIDMISDWVAGGMPEGDVAANPGLPEYPEGSQVGTPDLVLEMPEPYVHGGDGLEQYQVFVIPTGVTELKEIRAVEVRPGNNLIDHHALIGYTNNSNSIQEAIDMDEATEEPGYESFGDYGVLVEDDLFGGWVPGTPPLIFPQTIGKTMEPGSHLLLQMHYGEAFTDQSDQTQINIFFAEEPIEREVETYLMNPIHLTEPFHVPANEIVEFHGTLYIQSDVSLISSIPHSHLLGKSWKVYATSENNQDTIPIIDIPEWDFHWQGIFTHENLVHIPGGYTVHAIAEYDNTSSNPNNPNNPPQPMWFGDFTTDEMYVLFLQYVMYEEGDEDISFGTSSEEIEFVYNRNKLFPAWPNPASTSQDVKIGFHLDTTGERVTIELFDMQGKQIATWLNDVQYPQGYHVVANSTSDIPAGSYIYKITTSSGFTMSNSLQLVK